MWTLFRSSLFACLLALVVGGRLSSQGRVVEYDLVIAQTTLSPAGKPRPALTINGAIRVESAADEAARAERRKNRKSRWGNDTKAPEGGNANKVPLGQPPVRRSGIVLGKISNEC